MVDIINNTENYAVLDDTDEWLQMQTEDGMVNMKWLSNLQLLRIKNDTRLIDIQMDKFAGKQTVPMMIRVDDWTPDRCSCQTFSLQKLKNIGEI